MVEREASGAIGRKAPAYDAANTDIRAMNAATIPPYMRICVTSEGCVRLTPTEVRILTFVGRNEGRGCSKRQIAEAVGRNEKTVSRSIHRLREYRVLEVEPVYGEHGMQLANMYWLARRPESQGEPARERSHAPAGQGEERAS